MNKESNFQKIYDTWSPAMYRFFYYKVGDQANAQDLVQELFVKVWGKIGSIKLGEEKTYLYTIARNMVINRAAHEKVVLKFQNRQVTQINKNTPHFQLEVKEYKEKVEQAIACLSDGQREVFLMNRMDGLKYREIADLLGISQKAVEKRMGQALLKLKNYLGRKI